MTGKESVFNVNSLIDAFDFKKCNLRMRNISTSLSLSLRLQLL